MKSTSANHEYYGELSALAAIGQLSPEEHLELQAHLESCAACREEHAALTHFQLFELPLAHPTETTEVAQALTSRYTDHSEHDEWSLASRVAHAKADATNAGGIWHKAWQLIGLRPIHTYASVLVLFLALSVIVVGVYQHQKLDNLRDTEVARLRTQMQDLSIRPMDRPALPATTSAANEAGSNTPSGLVHVPASELVDKAEYASLLTHNRDLKTELQSASEEIQALRDQASSSGTKEDQLLARLSETDSALANIKNELQAAREVHAQDTAEIRKQHEQFERMEAEFKAANDSIERDRSLLVKDIDIRSVMSARNLRIVDVFDVDSKGKTRKPFGRVFFTEGKSLIFYAFDMPTGRSGLQSAAYQAWGYEGSLQSGVRSLGIFYQDDQKASRWALKVDDPQTLAEIDNVFVTLEPPGGSKKPTGNALLSAYLKANINHP